MEDRSNEISNRKFTMFMTLTMNNYPNWRRSVLDEALEYGNAGSGLQDGAIDPRDIPTFDQVDDEGPRIYQNNAIGNSIYLSDKRAAEEYNRDLVSSSQRLLAKIIKSWDKTVTNKMFSNVNYAALRNARDLIGIWNLIQELIFNDADGVFTASNASEAFQALSQEDETFDSFVIDLRRIVTAMDDFGAAIPQILVSSKLLNCMNCRGIPGVVSQHATFSTTVPLPDIEVMIPVFQRLFRADLSNSKKKKKKNKTNIPQYQHHQQLQNYQERVIKPDQVQALVSIDVSNVDRKRAVNECTNCKRVGHFMKECPQRKVTCNICKKLGHRDEYCKKARKNNNNNGNYKNNNNNNNNNNNSRPLGNNRNTRNVALFTNDNNVCFMCIECVDDTNTESPATYNIETYIECSYCHEIGHTLDTCRDYAQKKEDAFYDVFGGTSESEYESDDYNEITFDNSINNENNNISSVVNDENNIYDDWFDHYTAVLTGETNEQSTICPSKVESNPELSHIYIDTPIVHNRIRKRKNERKRKDDRIKKRIATRAMAKKQREHADTVLCSTREERIWNNDTRKFVQDLRSLLAASDQGISYKSLLPSTNNFYNTMNEIIDILNNNENVIDFKHDLVNQINHYDL